MLLRTGRITMAITLLERLPHEIPCEVQRRPPRLLAKWRVAGGPEA